MIGPALAGVLIAWVGAPTVLIVDAVSYLAAFAVVALFIRGGKPVQEDDDSRGVLAGVRYLARDPVLGPITLTVIVLDASAGAFSVAIPLLAFTRFDRNPHVAGWVFTAFGIGAIAGSVAAMKLLDRFRPLRLASAGVVLATLPVWLLVLDVPVVVVGAAMLVCGRSARRCARRTVCAVRHADRLADPREAGRVKRWARGFCIGGRRSS